MCLAVPGKIVDVWEDQGTRMATVDFDGIRKEICLAYVPDAELGGTHTPPWQSSPLRQAPALQVQFSAPGSQSIGMHSSTVALHSSPESQVPLP